jgi:hypothetical protein
MIVRREKDRRAGSMAGAIDSVGLADWVRERVVALVSLPVVDLFFYSTAVGHRFWRSGRLGRGERKPESIRSKANLLGLWEKESKG